MKPIINPINTLEVYGELYNTMKMEVLCYVYNGVNEGLISDIIKEGISDEIESRDFRGDDEEI